MLKVVTKLLVGCLASLLLRSRCVLEVPERLKDDGGNGAMGQLGR